MSKVFDSDNLKFMRSNKAPCETLKNLIVELRAVAKKDKPNALFYNPHINIDQFVERTRAKILADLRDYCTHAFHNLNHTSHVFSFAQKILGILLKRGKITQREYLISITAILYHDIRHRGITIRQTIEDNVSNEEYAIVFMLFDQQFSLSANTNLEIASCIAATAFGQGHLQDATNRSYAPKTKLECLVAACDTSGCTHKVGYEDNPGIGFIEDSLNVFKEMPARRAIKFYPDFETWIAHEQFGMISFLNNVCRARFQKLIDMDLLFGKTKTKIMEDIASVEIYLNLMMAGQGGSEVRARFIEELKSKKAGIV